METTTNAVPPHVLEALSRVLEHLWEDEEKDFRTVSPRRRNHHIYQALTVLARWKDNPSGAPDYFGDCPKCEHRGNDGYLNIGREHWILCHIHRLKWCVGENLFSSWRRETRDNWEDNHRRIARYRKIPIPINPEDFKPRTSE